MTAVGGSEFVFKVERAVLTFAVVVTDDVVRTRDDTAGTPGAQLGVNDLLEQFFPLGGPAGTYWWGGLGGRHGSEVTPDR